MPLTSGVPVIPEYLMELKGKLKVALLHGPRSGIYVMVCSCLCFHPCAIPLSLSHVRIYTCRHAPLHALNMNEREVYFLFVREVMITASLREGKDGMKEKEVRSCECEVQV